MSNSSVKIWLAIWAAIIAAVYFTSDRNYKDSESEDASKKPPVKREKELKVIYKCKKKIEDDYKLLLTELKLAENFMSVDQDKAICHFANAIIMSSDPLMFVNSLSQTLPSSAFKKLMNVLGEDFRRQWEASIADVKSGVLFT